MGAMLLANVEIWDGENDAAYPGEVLIEGNRIKSVAKARNQIAKERASDVIDGGGMFLMPGMVEGHCHLSFVGISQNKELGEIPVEEHLLRTCRGMPPSCSTMASPVPIRRRLPRCGST